MIYALYHSRTETVGSLGEVLKRLGLPLRELHLYQGDGLPRDTHQLTGLIVMGGPMNVDDVNRYPFLFEEVRLLEKVLCEEKPVLGICLGAQLIAKALGSKVFPNKEKEVGWHPITPTEAAATDSVFQEVPDSLDVLHWHGDTFHLPEGAVHLARSARCENQAFRWKENTYGLQFHLEDKK
jgi:GMP synthase (glutamine-hydrolysing)